jgi:hypothetical protein
MYVLYDLRRGFSGRSRYESIWGGAQGGDQMTSRVAAARFRWIRHVGPPRTGDRHGHLVDTIQSIGDIALFSIMGRGRWL